jgi:23S rRNA maturation-related 3'-5' exoribonuclease YhaM
MNLTPEQIQENWIELMNYIEKYISSPRKEKILEFYEQYSERLILMPAAHKKEYHNAFPGGYVEHVLRVIRCAIKTNYIMGRRRM